MNTPPRDEILEIIKGFEPVGHLDGTPEQNVIPSGYDLIKDERTEFGFYWEYEDMEKCASKILNLIASKMPEKEKLSVYSLNMGVDTNPPSETTRTNLYRNGWNAYHDTFKSILKGGTGE